MSLARRQLLSVALTAVAAPAVARLAWGETTQVTLKLHHFASFVSHGHATFLLPWARKVEADSGGRINLGRFLDAARV